MPVWLDAEMAALLGRGIGLTVSFTLITAVVAFVLGIGAGTMRLSRFPIWRRAATIYIEVHRNVPALVLIIFWAFAFPNLFPAAWRSSLFFNNLPMDALSRLTGLAIPYYAVAAGIGLIFNTSAYLAEQYRAGTRALAVQHIEAARLLGAGKWQVWWHFQLPQGVRVAWPAMSTRFIHHMKNSALVAFVSVPDFFHATQAAITLSFRAVELLLMATIVYLCLSLAMATLLRAVEYGLKRSFSAPDEPLEVSNSRFFSSAAGLENG